MSDETTLYFRHESGSVGRLTTSQDPDDVVVPDGATVITAEAYAQARAEIEAGNAAYVGELVEVEERQRVEDYEALIALRVPEATARRLTGHVMKEV